MLLSTLRIDYFWDVSATAGYDAGNGTWGTDNYWTTDGTHLFAWQGAGKSATFTGSDGAPNWTVTVSGTQNVDSLAFLNSGYIITGGTALNFGTKPGILVAATKSATINTANIRYSGTFQIRNRYSNSGRQQQLFRSLRLSMQEQFR